LQIDLYGVAMRRTVYWRRRGLIVQDSVSLVMRTANINRHEVHVRGVAVMGRGIGSVHIVEENGVALSPLQGPVNVRGRAS
jgi:hypothetical protein